MPAADSDVPPWIPRYSIESTSVFPDAISVLNHPLAPNSPKKVIKPPNLTEPEAGPIKSRSQSDFFDPLGVTYDEEELLVPEAKPIPAVPILSRGKREVELVNTLEMKKSDILYHDVDLPNMEPWRKKRSLILEKFGTSEKSSIQSPHSLKNDESIPQRAQVRVHDRTAHRLEILEDMSGLKKLVDLSAHEFVQNLNELKEMLVLAWTNSKRVEALRLVTELSRALSAPNPPSLFPSHWVLATDVLDLFGTLVYDRLKEKADQEREAAGKLPLAANFSADDVPEKTREKAKHWFSKLEDIREVVPRLYVEASLVRTKRFFDPTGIRENLHRLAAGAGRILQPLPAAYARAYVSKISMLCDPADRAPHWRVLNDWMQTFGQQPSELMWPAAEWIIQCVSYDAHAYGDLAPLWEYCVQTDKRFFILPCFLKAVQPKYLGNHAIEALRIILNEGASAKEISAFGERLAETEVPEEARPVLLKNMWKAIVRLQSTSELAQCSAVWAALTARYFSLDELDAHPDEHADQLLVIVRCMAGHRKSDAMKLLSLDSFTKIMDILRDDPHSSAAATAILEAFVANHAIGSCKDLKLASKICEITARLATFLYDDEEEKERRTALVCQVLDRFSFSEDPERGLQWLVSCRASLAEMDGAIQHIVQLFQTLGLQVLAHMKSGQAKANLMRACVANLQITIPSLPMADEQFEQALRAAHLALYANSLPQTDALLRICIESLMDSEADAAHFVAKLTHLLAFLVHVPDNPDKPPLYLFSAMLAVIDRRNWESTPVEHGASLVHCLDFLWAAGQAEYPTRFPSVQSNDELYGASDEFRESIGDLASHTLDRLIPMLMREPTPLIAAMLLEHLVARTDYVADEQLFLLCRGLLQRCRKSVELRKRVSRIITDLRNEKSYAGATKLLEACNV
ncbi:unnamed protein product, partial [Mesorhabditis spiculigera]